jgi:DnaJ-class molecular chaperone
MSWPDPTDESWEPVTCPACAGTGYVVENDGARDWCDECGASGEVDPQHADKLARERASCVSISSYLDDR